MVTVPEPDGSLIRPAAGHARPRRGYYDAGLVQEAAHSRAASPSLKKGWQEPVCRPPPKPDLKTRVQEKHSAREGIPVVPVLAGGVLLIVGVVYAGFQGPSMRAWAGWVIMVTLFVLQGAGIHIMWTLTWDLAAVSVYLMGSDEALAVMACIGVCGVSVPWYLCRIYLQKYDFIQRALLGHSAWVKTSLLAPLGYHGSYPHEVAKGCLELGFYQLDAALHILPTMFLLQQCAEIIRPIHVLYAVASTIFWAVTLSKRHVVIDWQRLWKGRLVYKRWGSSSFFEPLKVAQIYGFVSELAPPDEAYSEHLVPVFLWIFVATSGLTACLAALPRGGEMFFMLGGGQIISSRGIGFMFLALILGAVVALSAFLWKLYCHWSSSRSAS